MFDVELELPLECRLILSMKIYLFPQEERALLVMNIEEGVPFVHTKTDQNQQLDGTSENSSNFFYIFSVVALWF